MTHPTVDFTSPTDSLLRNPRLDHSIDVSLLGIALRFDTNSAYVRDMVEDTFGAWRNLPSSLISPGDPLRVTVQVFAGSEGAEEDALPALRYICYDDARYIIHTPGSVAMIDPDRGEASAYVTADLASRRALFRHSVLEAIGLSLVAHHDRHPIHASAVGRGDHVVLFAGASGTGKSTLAYMAHAAGLDVLTEDALWVQLDPGLRFWGWARHIHLRPEATRFFPELAGHAIRDTDASGKIVVDIRREHEAHSFEKSKGTVCVIDRGSGSPSLERLSRADLVRILTDQLTQGYDRYPERLESTVAAIATDGGWKLSLTDDPREALPLLMKLVGAAP
jgi:hypothetical protein